MAWEFLVRCRACVPGRAGYRTVSPVLPARSERTRAAARRTSAGGGVGILPPATGFYLFPDFSPFTESLRRRGITTSGELCERLLEETGIAILSGSDFGMGALVEVNVSLATEAMASRSQLIHSGITKRPKRQPPAPHHLLSPPLNIVPSG